MATRLTSFAGFGITKILLPWICPKNLPGIFGMNSQRAGFCQLSVTGLASQRSRGRNLPKDPACDFSGSTISGRDFADPEFHMPRFVCIVSNSPDVMVSMSPLQSSCVTVSFLVSVLAPLHLICLPVP